MALQKGVLIVFEGIDGSGKSTQAEILLKRLREEGVDAVYFREPSKGKWGRKIKKKALHPDSLTAEQELDLFLKDRRENVAKNLKPALKKKRVVILDRYYYSTIAYQGAKGIDEKLIRRMHEEFAVEPDLVFILDIDPHKGLERIENRKKKDRLFEREDYLAKVREIFRSFKGEKFIHLDALKSKKEISQEIDEIVLRLIL
jgi:dTMP kinase